MIYYANPSTPRVREVMRTGLIGAIATPMQGNRLDGITAWVADNGKFGKGWPGYHRWGTWLASMPRQGCRFAVAPDTPFDAAATLRMAGPALRLIRRLGFPAALAAQDGLEHMTIPWAEFDVLFIGGTTAWKLSPAARELVRQARG